MSPQLLLPPQPPWPGCLASSLTNLAIIVIGGWLKEAEEEEEGEDGGGPGGAGAGRGVAGDGARHAVLLLPRSVDEEPADAVGGHAAAAAEVMVRWCWAEPRLPTGGRVSAPCDDTSPPRPRSPAAAAVTARQ